MGYTPALSGAHGIYTCAFLSVYPAFVTRIIGTRYRITKGGSMRIIFTKSCHLQEVMMESARVLDDEYVECISSFRRTLTNLNPLQYVIVDDGMKQLLCSSADFLQLTVDEKNSIKKHYKNWCRTNHPDKLIDIEGWEKETSMHIMKMYGDAFSKCDEEEFDQCWTFMGYFAIIFNGRGW